LNRLRERAFKQFKCPCPQGVKMPLRDKRYEDMGWIFLSSVKGPVGVGCEYDI